MIDTGIPDEPLAYILIPIITRDKVLGVISVQSYTPNAFNEIHVAMLSAIASQSAVALDNTRLFAQERRRSSELTLLERIGYELARITDLSTALKEIITETRDLLEADSVSIYTYDERQGKFRPQAFTIAAGDAQPSQRSKPPRLRGVTSRIVQRRSAIITRALPGGAIGFEEIPLEQGIDPELRQPFELTDSETIALIRERNIHLSIGFPLTAGMDMVGVLYISYTHPHEFRWEDLRTIARLAQHAATAIQRANVYDQIHALHQAGQALTGQADMKPVIEKLFEYGHTILGADIIVLFSYHAAAHKFDTPPLYSGQVYQPDMLTNYGDVESDDVVWQIIAAPEGFFTRTAQTDARSAGLDVERRPTRFVGREKIESSAALPLRAEDEVVGALFFNYRVPQRFGSHQRLLINTFATYAATAIQRVRLMSRRVDELRALAAIDKVITGGSLQEVLDTIIRSACQIVGVSNGNIMLAIEEGQYLYPAATHGEAWQTGSPEQFKIGALGVTGWVAQHKQPARIGNVRTEAPWKDLYVEVLPGVQSELAVPILDEHGVLVGVINLESRAANAFLADDERLLVALAEQAYIAIRNQRQFEAEQRARKVLGILGKVDQAIITQAVSRQDDRPVELRASLSNVLELILNLGLDAINAPTGNIMLYDETQGDLYMAVERGVRPEHRQARQRLGEGVVGRVARERQTLLISDVTMPPWDAIYQSFIPHIRSELATPLLRNGRLVGVLNAESPHAGAFGPEDRELFETLAGQAVIAYQNAERYQVLQTLRDINQLLASGYDAEEVIKSILLYACIFIEAEWGNLALYDPAGHPTRDYVLVQSAFSAEPDIQVRRPPQPDVEDTGADGIVGWVARQRQPYRSVGNVQDDPRFRGHVGLEIRSEMAVPLLVGQELVGVLNLESERENAFDEDDLDRLKDISAAAAIAVRNARTLEELRQARERFEALTEAGTGIINAPLDEQPILEVVLTIGLERTGAFHAVAWLLDSTDNLLKARLAQGEQSDVLHEPVAFGQFINGLAWQEGRRILVEDTRDPVEAAQYRPGYTDHRSILVVPMLAGGEYFGNLDFRHREAHGFKPEEVALIEGLTGQATSAIRQVRDQRELEATRQRERDAQAMAALGLTAGELGHRIGNKFGLFATHINAIWEEIGPGHPEINQRLNFMLANVKYILSLTERLKQEWSDRASGLDRPRQIFPARVILSEASRLRQPPPGIQVLIDLPDSPLDVLADERIFDAFANIYMNALEALEQKGGGVIRMSACEGQNGWVEFQISDDGPGIEERQQEKIFSLFYSTKKDGLGFGLFSAKQRVLASGGQIDLNSMPGEGTTFIIRLPSAVRGGDT
ncbi:MAG TPA: GAF domain-containing protein [Anaerolineae bacterium]|nr:GAF domain-containing protein [Anaerolineae bacterium]